MLLLFCEEFSLFDGTPLLLAESSLRADFDPEVVNIPSLSSFKPYFTLEADQSALTAPLILRPRMGCHTSSSL